MNDVHAEGTVRIGISACLLGRKVRYDGDCKRDHFLSDTLGQYVEWAPVCPEVELGLPVPRPTMRLKRTNDRLRLIVPAEGKDLTAAMKAFAKRRVAALAAEGLDGFILKSKSPSCGPSRVKIHQDHGRPVRQGRGLFAEALFTSLPNLPIEDEGRLHEPKLRENWITRVFAYRRITALWQKRWKIGDLAAFHAAEKLLLLAHSPKEYRELESLVAQSKAISRRELRETYERQFLGTLTKLATPAKNANVLRHLVGFFENELDQTSRRVLLDQIEAYRQGLIPLIVPLTLLAHYARVFDIPNLREQVYLNPHPKELALKSHV